MAEGGELVWGATGRVGPKDVERHTVPLLQPGTSAVLIACKRPLMIGRRVSLLSQEDGEREGTYAHCAGRTTRIRRPGKRYLRALMEGT